MTAAQEGLFLGRDGGLYRRYVTDGQIDHAAWLRAVAAGQFVGECRRCGGHLAPERPEQHHGRSDYTAACSGEDCGYEMTAPGGRLSKPQRART